MIDIKSFIQDVPDFPKPGIVFKDITPLLLDGEAFAATIDQMVAQAEPDHCDVVIGIESRGFIFGAAIARQMGLGFIPVRKPGKLCRATVSAAYELEYGTDCIEMHEDALAKGHRALLVDDLLATGGTMAACCKLVESLGAHVYSCSFVVELGFLKGREKLSGHKLHSLVTY